MRFELGSFDIDDQLDYYKRFAQFGLARQILSLSLTGIITALFFAFIFLYFKSKGTRESMDPAYCFLWNYCLLAMIVVFPFLAASNIADFLEFIIWPSKKVWSLTTLIFAIPCIIITVFVKSQMYLLVYIAYCHSKNKTINVDEMQWALFLSIVAALGYIFLPSAWEYMIRFYGNTFSNVLFLIEFTISNSCLWLSAGYCTFRIWRIGFRKIDVACFQTVLLVFLKLIYTTYAICTVSNPFLKMLYYEVSTFDRFAVMISLLLSYIVCSKPASTSVIPVIHIKD